MLLFLQFFLISLVSAQLNIKSYPGKECTSAHDCTTGVCLNIGKFTDPQGTKYGTCCQYNVDGCTDCLNYDPEGGDILKKGQYPGQCISCQHNLKLFNSTCVEQFKCKSKFLRDHCNAIGNSLHQYCCWNCEKPCKDGLACSRVSKHEGVCVTKTLQPTTSPFPSSTEAPSYKKSKGGR